MANALSFVTFEVDHKILGIWVILNCVLHCQYGESTIDRINDSYRVLVLS